MQLRRLTKVKHGTQQKEMTNQSYISIKKCEDVHVCMEQLRDSCRGQTWCTDTVRKGHHWPRRQPYKPKMHLPPLLSTTFLLFTQLFTGQDSVLVTVSKRPIESLEQFQALVILHYQNLVPTTIEIIKLQVIKQVFKPQRTYSIRETIVMFSDKMFTSKHTLLPNFA